MTDKDRQLLDSVKQMEEQAPEVGLCGFPFKILHDEIAKLIAERDALENPPKPDYSTRCDEIPDVLMFIGRFSTDGNKDREQVKDAFLFGGCWWFAFILKSRFEREYPCEIVVDYASNHFACRINGSVYDITGRRADSGEWERWDDCTDEALKKRITEDCIMF
jgi:hypothetical protein